ncbi:MAG: TetR/AcrR family transcriptional regulator [Acidobacteriota bacterium]|nr:TetR/AcrR family transcriptional regulator [Acidobacteriota bacterium]
MGSSPRRKESCERKKDAILQAARTVFARKGFASTVVEDIAEEAGIGKGTLYLYFPSKEQIYLAALHDDAHTLDGESRRALAEARSWRDALRSYVEVRLHYFEAHQDFLRIYMTEFRGMCMQGRPLSAELYRLAQDGEALLAQCFAAAAARGEIRAVDPELAALMVSDVTRGLIERRLRAWGRPLGESDTAFAVDMLRRALEP